ncbi:MAG: DUF3108 domain-containing protein [Flavobacteriales bacterium]|nr:DUF3108 domain-containing protein [Flavobacteriales bacterium]
MNKIILLILLVNFKVYAQGEHISFKKGEKLEYKIHYGPLAAGIARLEVKTINNQYRFIATGKSTGLFNLFFKVRDSYESIVDKTNLHPNQFYRDVKEGSYKKKESVFFNYKLQQAESTRDTIPLPKNTQDILSIFYYLRAQNFDTLKVGESFPIQIYLDDEFMESNLYYLGADTIKTKFGWIPCTKWAPELETGRVFKDDYGMNLWISDDANKIPLQIKTKVLVGSIKMDLIKYSGTIEPLRRTY